MLGRMEFMRLIWDSMAFYDFIPAVTQMIDQNPDVKNEIKKLNMTYNLDIVRHIEMLISDGYLVQDGDIWQWAKDYGHTNSEVVNRLAIIFFGIDLSEFLFFEESSQLRPEQTIVFDTDITRSTLRRTLRDNYPPKWTRRQLANMITTYWRSA
jgi:hypothetical protein